MNSVEGATTQSARLTAAAVAEGNGGISGTKLTGVNDGIVTNKDNYFQFDHLSR